MITRIDTCNGCPECRGCGRGWRTVTVCDRCGAEIWDEDEVFYADGEDLCRDCMKENEEGREEA